MVGCERFDLITFNFRPTKLKPHNEVCVWAHCMKKKLHTLLKSLPFWLKCCIQTRREFFFILWTFSQNSDLFHISHIYLNSVCGLFKYMHTYPKYVHVYFNFTVFIFQIKVCCLYFFVVAAVHLVLSFILFFCWFCEWAFPLQKLNIHFCLLIISV